MAEAESPSRELVKTESRGKRKEQAVVLQSQAMRQNKQGTDVFGDVPVSTFDTEVDPFSFAVLDEEHFVLFRKVWRERERFVQGAVIARQPFFQQLIETAFRATALSRASDLIVGYQAEVLNVFTAVNRQLSRGSSVELSGSLLFRTRLSAPFSDVALIFSVRKLPLGPGGTVISWTALILLVVLCAGFVIMYRLGVGQIRLHRQQQDFVSAVSHELKTPLTSIRMYGEMLRAGWVDEEKSALTTIFIFHESERLSRLIANVLQLARMTRNATGLELEEKSVAELVDMIKSKVSSQVQHAGFNLDACLDGVDGVKVRVDTDAFSQIRDQSGRQRHQVLGPR